jgi:signal transduction histidine kinase
MWTRLVAGAAAHEVNNLVQGLFNLLALGTGPGTSRESLDEYAGLARDGLKDLRRFGMDLRALADAGPGAKPERLELAIVEAVSEIEAPRDRSVDVGPLAPDVFVQGSSAAIRFAIKSVVRYGVAASAPGGGVRVSVSLDEATALVVVVVPTATELHSKVEADLATLLAGEERELGGDAGLVLAGAATHLCGGAILAGPAPGGGLRFKVGFPRVGEDPRLEAQALQENHE